MNNVQQTSMFAFRSEILPNIANTQKEVFEAIEKHPEGVTDMELAREMGWERTSINGRRNELSKLKLVVELAQRPCKITGRTAIAWGKSGLVV